MEQNQQVKRIIFANQTLKPFKDINQNLEKIHEQKSVSLGYDTSVLSNETLSQDQKIKYMFGYYNKVDKLQFDHSPVPKDKKQKSSNNIYDILGGQTNSGKAGGNHRDSRSITMVTDESRDQDVMRPRGL